MQCRQGLDRHLETPRQAGGDGDQPPVITVHAHLLAQGPCVPDARVLLEPVQGRQGGATAAAGDQGEVQDPDLAASTGQLQQDGGVQGGAEPVEMVGCEVLAGQGCGDDGVPGERDDRGPAAVQRREDLDVAVDGRELPCGGGEQHHQQRVGGAVLGAHRRLLTDPVPWAAGARGR